MSVELLADSTSPQHPADRGADARDGIGVGVFIKMHRNPYGQLLYGTLARHGVRLVDKAQLTASWLWRHRGRVAVLHFHWDQCLYEVRPEDDSPFVELRCWLKTLHYAAMLTLARSLGYKLLWTVHEVLPHEPRSRRRDLLAGRLLGRSSHALLAHDEATAERAARVLRTGERKITVVSHGSYAGWYPTGRPPEVVREEWGLRRSSFVFLAFGTLRRYKRIDLLLDAFARVEDPSCELVVAGGFLWRRRQPEWELEMEERLRQAAAQDPRIHYRTERVADEQVAELHGAVNAMVLARSDGWTSGSMILAMTNGLPVVAARQPAYVDLLGDGDAGWLYESGSARTLAHAMTSAASDGSAAAKGRAARRRAEALDWNATAAQTASVIFSVLSAQRALPADGRH
jgi:glycosyltransferase involved in cell wall biosynthesis